MPISIPKFFQRAFAQNGGKQDVPITGDNSGGRASYDVGFPPVTRVPIVAGGIPPFGTDFNGVLYDLSQAIQYLQSGVTFPFDQDFADAIGGYSVKAIVADPVDPTILWQNNNANNTLPPSAPNGWTQVFSAAELNQNPTESQRGAPFLASNAEADAGVDNTKMMSAAKVLRLIRAVASRATESLSGTMRFATASEMSAGNSDSLAISPARLSGSHFCPLGILQSWVDVRASRSLNTLYTNTSSRAIQLMVAVRTNVSSEASYVELLVNDVLLFSDTTATHVGDYMICCVIPPYATYRINSVSNIVLRGWSELR